MGATTIAFGHHQDDSAQTLLLNLLHKAEFAGNLPKVPMHDYGITIIRPMIYVDEDSLRTFAKQYGFARITCQCPVGQKSKRKICGRSSEIHRNGNFQTFEPIWRKRHLPTVLTKQKMLEPFDKG